MAAKPQKATPVQVALTVALSPDSYAFVEKAAVENGGDVAGTLAGWIGYWVENQAGGGISISPVEHDHLASLAGGKRFASSRALVRAVEKGMNRIEGSFSSTVKVDPALIAPLKDHAATMGWTPEELLNDGLNNMLTNGWLYGFEPEHVLRFTKETMEIVREFVGKAQLTGEDLANKIKPKPEVKVED